MDDSVPTQTVQEWLKRAKAQGNYFIVCRSYMRVLGRDLGLFLCDVLNFGYMRRDRLKDGWFLCSVKDLQGSLGWDHASQAKWINKLKALELLETKKTKTIPSKRIIRVNLVKLEQLVDAKDVQVAHTSAGTDVCSTAGTDVYYRSKSYRLTLSQENPPRRRGGDSLEGEPDMVFFPDKEVQCQMAEQDKARARRLRTITTSLGKLQPWSLKKWANYFRLLRAERGEAEVEGMLQWYERAAPTIKKPNIVNAGSFRKNFDWLKEIREKEQDDPATLQVTADALDVARFVQHLGWPKGSKAQLGPAAQRVIAAYAQFRKKLQLVKQDNSFARYLLKVLPADPVAFGEQWMRREFHRVQNWDDWSGNLFKQVWDGRLDHKEFRKYMRGLAGAYSDRPDDWDKLAEELR